MKWKKLGCVFCPENSTEWMTSHASVPIAQHREDDIFRIYFSTRDSNSRSYGAFVDINIRSSRKILSVSRTPVLAPSSPGFFDDNGTMLSWISYVNNIPYLYYVGWNLGVTVPFRNAIGLAVYDKKTGRFEKYSEGPIMDRGVFDQSFVASCSTLRDANGWRMWYTSCSFWDLTGRKPKHYYNIKYAESIDGINWVRNGVICIDFSDENEYAISRPCVIKVGDIYRMWYSRRGDSYRIGYAVSDDGISWTRFDGDVGIDVSESGWDSEMIEYPYVFDHKGQRYMLYNGNNYGLTGFGLAILDKE